MKHNREMLAEHGTELMVLKPSSIVQTAEADMKRMWRNLEEATTDAPAYEQYAFHRSHVRRASDAQDLIVRALMDPGPGLQSGKYNTRLLYGNGALLRQALMLTREALVDSACAILDGTCDCPREDGHSLPTCKRHAH